MSCRTWLCTLRMPVLADGLEGASSASRLIVALREARVDRAQLNRVHVAPSKPRCIEGNYGVGAVPVRARTEEVEQPLRLQEEEHAGVELAVPVRRRHVVEGFRERW